MSDSQRKSTYYRVFDNALALSEKIERVGRRRFGELTGRQIIFLAMIGSFETEPSLGDMARKGRCSHQNAKTVLAALEKKSFLTFELDSNDQRILRVYLTEKGEAAAQRALAELDTLIERIGRRISTEEARSFAVVVDELTEALEEAFALPANEV